MCVLFTYGNFAGFALRTFDVCTLFAQLRDGQIYSVYACAFCHRFVSIHSQKELKSLAPH